MKKAAQTLRSGFTLVELLVVIAVIGVLATIVLLAVNPAEQLARGRDTSRQAAITQVGRALQGYFTANSALYPAQSTAAIDALVTSGDMKTVPVNPSYTTAPSPTCAAANLQSTTSPVSNYCYLTNAGRSDAIVYSRMESTLNNTRGGCATSMWFVFSTNDGRAGFVCSATEPAVGAQTYTP